MGANTYKPIIRDNIEGNRLVDKPNYVSRVLATQQFQRLRNIRQMGLAHFTFPTAEHSRFAHSLGVLATAQSAFSHLAASAMDHNLIMPGLRFDEAEQADFSIAAMCHDLGHTSFSHALETTLLPSSCRSHEECTVQILADSTSLAQAIRDVADLDAVIALISHRHANPALNDLVSGAFDVDRCDYVLRDSAMTGVEYGQYDLKWLVRSLTIELDNQSRRPILVLNGPRGMDALRQFLSARRYMHRQVYFHKSVRAAQLLLKSIFERLQDVGKAASSATLSKLRPLIPKPLRCLLESKRPTLGEFLETTDAEVMCMIRSLAADYAKDPVLNYLCKSILRRHIPKCVMDSSVITRPLDVEYSFANHIADDEVNQGELWPTKVDSQPEVIDKLRAFVRRQLRASSLPEDLSLYLVKFDEVQFRSFLPSDFRFEFGSSVVSYDEIRSDIVGFDIKSLLEAFTITRLFVPRDVVQESKEFFNDTYRAPL